MRTHTCCAYLLAQVVVVAAGYDTRAYRLIQPGVTFFEVKGGVG